jgi:tRNA-dihydrouridine synthase A
MLGREAYHNPYLLAEVDRCLFSDTHDAPTRQQVALQMRTYIEAHLQQGGQMQHITRHMLGLAQGFPGARRFRQLLSADIHRHPEPLALYDEACKLLEGR